MRQRHPTITSAAMMTGVGMLLGTAAYWSPEQARGKAVAKRSDIWAFGCIVFEMLSGRPAFGGESGDEMLARVIEREPAWSALPIETPLAVRRVLRRCLEKDPPRIWETSAASKSLLSRGSQLRSCRRAVFARIRR
jgi:serine/threonine protein kinase